MKQNYQYFSCVAFRVHGGLEPLVELIKENKDNTNRDNKVRIHRNSFSVYWNE